ncbi:hypothetical protein [Rhizobacter sp. OV335]|uniref:hypothetical protein n=1 Tax=Rhizobacter sp. OV335 TaxID=1500264 RepID=UPI0009210B12|nr:hypothetical protein [Rhizobacter sp. OV335]SHN39638.1 hypothetical protein SAMN02787076_06100 [Rhizobacter sp. OV335]
MKAPTCLIAAFVAAGLAASAFAASVLEFDVWMRAIDKSSVAVQKSIARQDAPAARAEAREIERLYALMEAFFRDDVPAADALQVSTEGRELAASIAPLLEAGDYERAGGAARRIAQACNDCHDPHKPFK